MIIAMCITYHAWALLHSLDQIDQELLYIFICLLCQKYCLRCELRRGTYTLITFTTGCHLTGRESQPVKKANLTIGSGENMKLTRMFR